MCFFWCNQNEHNTSFHKQNKSKEKMTIIFIYHSCECVHCPAFFSLFSFFSIILAHQMTAFLLEPHEQVQLKSHQIERKQPFLDLVYDCFPLNRFLFIFSIIFHSFSNVKLYCEMHWRW